MYSYKGYGNKAKYKSKYRSRRPRFSSKKPRKPRFKPESTVLLKIARLAVAGLLIALVTALVWFALSQFQDINQNSKSSSYNSVEELNSDLLRVVNKSNPLAEDYVPELVDVDGVQVSKLAEKPLRSLLEAAENAGVSLSADYAYVSYKEQGERYRKIYKKYREKHLSEVRAQALAERKVPQQGRSEYQTGLLVHFKTDENKSFEKSKSYAWLIKNCVDYGFVLRYPSDKTSQTSMDADYAAYRYVGEDNAEVMRSLNKSLNEYSLYVNSR